MPVTTTRTNRKATVEGDHCGHIASWLDLELVDRTRGGTGYKISGKSLEVLCSDVGAIALPLLVNKRVVAANAAL